MIPQIDECKPGFAPMGYNVLVALDVVPDKTVGGILLPDRHKDREDSASEKGRIVGISDMAFSGGDWAGCATPEAGSVVLFQRYAGTEMEGNDGRKYRVIADTDLKGVFQ